MPILVGESNRRRPYFGRIFLVFFPSFRVPCALWIARVTEEPLRSPELVLKCDLFAVDHDHIVTTIGFNNYVACERPRAT
jgi:hypothetical protein